MAFNLQPGAERDFYRMVNPEPEQYFICERCGNECDELRGVETRDVFVGYRETANVCNECFERLERI